MNYDEWPEYIQSDDYEQSYQSDCSVFDKQLDQVFDSIGKFENDLISECNFASHLQEKIFEAQIIQSGDTPFDQNDDQQAGVYPLSEDQSFDVEICTA